jgi:hypothetical protein
MPRATCAWKMELGLAKRASNVKERVLKIDDAYRGPLVIDRPAGEAARRALSTPAPSGPFLVFFTLSELYVACCAFNYCKRILSFLMILTVLRAPVLPACCCFCKL